MVLVLAVGEVEDLGEVEALAVLAERLAGGVEMALELVEELGKALGQVVLLAQSLSLSLQL